MYKMLGTKIFTTLSIVQIHAHFDTCYSETLDAKVSSFLKPYFDTILFG